MTLNRVFVPAVDQVSRALNNLSMSTDAEFRRLEERVANLEASKAPFLEHHVHSYSATQSIVLSSTTYSTLCSMTVDTTKGNGDSYAVLAVVDVEFPATGVFKMRLTDGDNTLYEAIDLERSGHGGELLFGVSKPVAGKVTTFYTQVGRVSGTGNATYMSHGMLSIRGYSQEAD